MKMKDEKADFGIPNEGNWSEYPDLNRPIEWRLSEDPIMIYTANVDGREWMIRINDFPDEPLFSVIQERQPVFHFND